LFDKVYHEIDDIDDQNPKLAKQIRDALKKDGVGNFSKMWKKNFQNLGNLTPYQLLKVIELDLTGPEGSQTQSTEPGSEGRSRDVPSIDVPNLVSKVKGFFRSGGPVIEGREVRGDRARVEELLNHLEEFIAERQQKLAAKIMTQRNVKVKSWKDELVKLDSPD
jgi:hypothetical protein